MRPASSGLVARGVSDLQYTGIVSSSAAVSQAEVVVNVDTTELISSSPIDGLK